MQRSGVWMGLMSTYGFDAEGRRTAMRYPTQGGVPALELEYQYDALSRLRRVATTGGGTVWADNAQYGVGGELTSLTWNNWTESRSYNALGQLTRQTIAGTADIEYVFSGTQNDGRITERKDYITGEQVVYQYDALGRLINATTGATGPQWGYSYTFDGFSNLYRKDVTKGSVPTLLISVDPATNRINTSGFGYSGNGNLTNAPGGWTYTYDPSNRMVTAAGPSGSDNYSYDAANKRVYRRKPDGSETIFFWSAAGELLGEFALSGTTLTGGTIDTQYIYFAGKMIRAKNQGVVTDRLGSVVYRGSTRINYYPYGEEQPTVTANDTFKYGTYFRDSTTGLDYAQNRYYSSIGARLQTADPSLAGAEAGLNQYSYVGGDPANRVDPEGLEGTWINYSSPPPPPAAVNLQTMCLMLAQSTYQRTSVWGTGPVTNWGSAGYYSWQQACSNIAVNPPSIVLVNPQSSSQSNSTLAAAKKAKSEILKEWVECKQGAIDGYWKDVNSIAPQDVGEVLWNTLYRGLIGMVAGGFLTGALTAFAPAAKANVEYTLSMLRFEDSIDKSMTLCGIKYQQGKDEWTTQYGL